MSSPAVARFETLLREYVVEHRRIQLDPAKRMTTVRQWDEAWELFSDDEIVAKLSAWTLTVTKEMLGAENAPSLKDLQALPEIDIDDKDPGVYQILVTTPSDPTDNTQYVGEGCSYGKGLANRTLHEHLSKAYRDRQRATGQNHLHNRIDQKGLDRQATAYKLAVGEFPSNSVEDMDATRILCQLLESIIMTWLRCFKDLTQPKVQLYMHCTPWTSWTADVRPVNAVPSAAQGIWKNGHDADLTKEETLARANPAEKEMRLFRQTERWRIMDGPARRMKEAGRSAEEVEAFRRSKDAELDRIAPLPSTVFGGGRRPKGYREKDAAKKRAMEADEDLAVEKPKAKRQRTRVSKLPRKKVVEKAKSPIVEEVEEEEELVWLEPKTLSTGVEDSQDEKLEDDDDDDDDEFAPVRQGGTTLRPFWK
jgi:hypothetical protein